MKGEIRILRGVGHTGEEVQRYKGEEEQTNWQGCGTNVYTMGLRRQLN